MSARSYLPIHWTYGSGTTTAAVTIPNQVAGNQSSLVVLDHVSCSITMGAAGNATLALSGDVITSKVLASDAVSGAVAKNFDIDYSNGLPVWTAINVSTSAETGVTLTVSGTGTPTAASIFVTYHYEQPSNRRP